MCPLLRSCQDTLHFRNFIKLLINRVGGVFKTEIRNQLPL